MRTIGHSLAALAHFAATGETATQADIRRQEAKLAALRAKKAKRAAQKSKRDARLAALKLAGEGRSYILTLENASGARFEMCAYVYRPQVGGMRDGNRIIAAESVPFICWEGDRMSLALTRHRAEAAKAFHAVQAALEALPAPKASILAYLDTPKTTAEVAKLDGRSKSTIGKALRVLYGKGILTRDTSSKPYRYCLASHA